MKKVLLTGEFKGELVSSLHVPFELLHLDRFDSYDEIRKIIPFVHGYILGGPEYLSSDLMDSAKVLEHLVVMGAGTPSFVDIKAAEKKGIRISNTPGINADTVAEFALGMMIIHNANAFHSQQMMKNHGEWYQTPYRSLSDQHIGLIGLGSIGHSMVGKLQKLGISNISYFSRTRNRATESALGLNFLELSELVACCDLVSIQVDYNETSHELLNYQLLNRCKKNLKLFCFSNPRVIDPCALRDCLLNGPLGFTYMDGYYNEWKDCKGKSDDESGLLGLPERFFVATSHIAAQSERIIDLMIRRAVRELCSGWGI